MDVRTDSQHSVTAGGGRGVVAALAPESAAALDALEATAWRVSDADLLDLAARICADVHGMQPLARPAELGPSPWEGRATQEWRAFDDLTEAQRIALAFAEQFTVDVAGVTEAQRVALTAALGEDALVFAQAVYVADVIARARTLLDRLFGPSPAAPAAGTGVDPSDNEASLWEAIEELIRVVPGLQALDPVTTELVRLRIARQHNCRICQSLRSYSAFVAGADDGTFDAVDFYATSDLDDAHKAALAFTDAFVWTPGRVADDVADRLRQNYSDAQQVELVLDMARNSANKFAVSMAADAPNVTEGYEVYDVAADGTMTYGMARP